MKTRLAAAFLSLAVAIALMAGDALAPKPTLGTMAWLAGAWSSEDNGREVTEQWMPPAGGTMLGMSRTVARGKTVEYEFILLREEADGTINYVAKPSGQAEAAFKLVRASATEILFENPQHDFPQRIIYTLKEGGQLTATIESTKNGKTRRVEFNYQRVKS